MDLVHQALIDEKARLDQARQLEIDYERAGDDAAARLTRDGQTGEQPQPAGAMTRGADNGKPGDDKPDLAPTRLTLALESDQYRFGAITADAAVPERVVSIDPSLVMKANDELAQEGDPDLQAERGIFLERLLLPRELQPYLATSAPLVMLLDPRTARVHWEMVAQPDPDEVMRGADGDAPSGEIPRAFDPYRFLGTARGLTRQLRTTFTAPPEPPPPPRRRLRVLVVADPADDASLPGAELEGGIVADLFEAFNTFPDRDRAAGDNVVEVTRLFGPTEATLTNVLRELMIRTYDVFHFAGHCFYNPNDPLGSGYIFHLDPLECLTAHELNRIDRIPKFVFSNACESGVTQDRIDLRSIDLPPSFAEAFFGRGVANFVCTAWPVDDLAARQFATTLYAGMLGLTIDADGRAIGSAEPLPIYRALRDARVAIAATPNGAQTWGAYQHYGNPFFRFFARLPASVPPAAAPHRRARPLPERHERGEAAAASAAGASPQVNDA
ncbi:MAG TPA: CHAT domain-containing protein [Thermomicrobiales bacterium]|nr:CHAT domain-containing protein [Thermomicrobiales bacterium]